MKSLYWIWSYNFKHVEQEDLIKEFIVNQLQPFLRKMPYFKSVRTYVRRMGIGQRPVIQTWIEISNCGAIDKWLRDIESKQWNEIRKVFFAMVEDFNSTVVYELC